MNATARPPRRTGRTSRTRKPGGGAGTAGSRNTSQRRRRTTRRSTRIARRRTPTLPATLGTALGALVVTFLLDASWPVRIGVVALVIVLALAAGRVALVRRERKEAAAGAPDPATAGGQVGDEASSAAYGTNPTDTQGDTTDD